MSRTDTPLRLVAFDADDLQLVSAATQDAVALLGDFEFSRARKTFTLAVNRFRWEAGRKNRRVRSGLQIGLQSLLKRSPKRSQQSCTHSWLRSSLHRWVKS